MGVTIKTDFMPKGSIREGKKKTRNYGVTIHETGNFKNGSNAAAHRDNQFRSASTGEVGFHYVVDDKEAYYLIPSDEICWHASDGEFGQGNTQTIAIETCVHPGIDFSAACTNAAEIAAISLRSQGITSVIDGTKDRINGTLFQHNTFARNGKDCPMNIRNYNLWDEFVAMVKAFMENKTPKKFTSVIPKDWSLGASSGSGGTTQPLDGEKAEIYSNIVISKNIGIVPSGFLSTSSPAVMNLYAGNTTSGTKICLWKEDHSNDQGFQIIKQSNGSYKIASAHNNSKFLKFSSVSVGSTASIS